jgi:hypothetical protein
MHWSGTYRLPNRYQPLVEMWRSKMFGHGDVNVKCYTEEPLNISFSDRIQKYAIVLNHATHHAG